MAKTHMFTTSLSPDILEWLRQFSKKRGTTQRSVLEEALKKYRFETRRQEFQNGFKAAAEDAEMLDLAEMGMEDYAEQIKILES